MSKVRRSQSSSKDSESFSLKKSKLIDLEYEELSSASSSNSSSFGIPCSDSKSEVEEEEILAKVKHYVPVADKFENLVMDLQKCATLDIYWHRMFAIGTVHSCSLKTPNARFTKSKKWQKFSIVIKDGNTPQLIRDLNKIEGAPQFDTEIYPDSIILIRTLEKGKGEEYIKVMDRKNKEEVDAEEGDLVIARIIPETNLEYRSWTFGWIRVIRKKESLPSKSVTLFADNEPEL